MTRRATPKAFDIATFTPSAPNYQPSSLEEQLRYDDRFEAANLVPPSQSTIVDNGTDKWEMKITSGKPGELTLQLEVPEYINWWKTIVIYYNAFGYWHYLGTLGTKNAKKSASLDFNATSAHSGTFKLDFWKAGFLGTGSWVHAEVIDVPSHLGNTVTFVCSLPTDP
jgi:hypothetical protein